MTAKIVQEIVWKSPGFNWAMMFLDDFTTKIQPPEVDPHGHHFWQKNKAFNKSPMVGRRDQ